MVKYTYVPKFQKTFKKLDNSLKIRIKKLVNKIIENPEIGKSMKYNRKGTREVYARSFRLSYSYDNDADELIFLTIYHKDEQ